MIYCQTFPIYSEAEEHYNLINTKYPAKKDLLKTTEHIAWRKKIREARATGNKLMELKIQLIQNHKKTTESNPENTTPPTDIAAIEPTFNPENTTESAVIDTDANQETGPDNGVSSYFITLAY